jgi:hypothetical protein
MRESQADHQHLRRSTRASTNENIYSLMLNVYQAAVLNSRYSEIGLRFKPVKEEKEYLQETQPI